MLNEVLGGLGGNKAALGGLGALGGALCSAAAVARQEVPLAEEH